MRPEDLGIGELFERVRDAVIVADARTQRIVLWNPAATRIFGYSASEAGGLRVEELVPEPLKGRHRAGMVRYSETGHGPYVDSHDLVELPALRKGGQEIRVELSLSPIDPVEETEGGGRFVLAIVRDVTERMRDEEARSRLAAIVASSDDAIIGKTLDGTITNWNSGAENIYGYAADEVLGCPITVLVPADRPSEVPNILELVKRGEKIDHYETVRVRKDGRRVHVSLTTSPIKDAEGNVVGASTVARDITERKRAEEEIRRLNETLERRVAERTAQLAERERQLAELVGRLIAAQEEERRRVAYRRGDLRREDEGDHAHPQDLQALQGQGQRDHHPDHQRPGDAQLQRYQGHPQPLRRHGHLACPQDQVQGRRNDGGEGLGGQSALCRQDLDLHREEVGRDLETEGGAGASAIRPLPYERKAAP